MILDLDVGNSRCKWRLSDAWGDPVERGVGVGYPAIAAAFSVDRVRIARVAGDVAHWRQWSRDRFGIEPEFARSTCQACGVVNGYLDPERLGVDRWLAICAAYSVARRACVVIDAGSAIVVDAVDSDGRHTGGYIAPGLRLLGVALVDNTAEVSWRADRVVRAQAEPGCDTQQAVTGGIAVMASAFMERALRQLVPHLAETPVVYLTGGDADQLLPLLPFDVECVPELVLDGLALVLP